MPKLISLFGTIKFEQSSPFKMAAVLLLWNCYVRSSVVLYQIGFPANFGPRSSASSWCRQCRVLSQLFICHSSWCLSSTPITNLPICLYWLLAQLIMYATVIVDEVISGIHTLPDKYCTMHIAQVIHCQRDYPKTVILKQPNFKAISLSLQTFLDFK